jgi:segregation and condensation protein B
MSNLENDLVDGADELLEDDGSEQPKEASADSLRILEAVLFASDELLTTARLKAILPDAPDAREIGAMVEKINRQLQNERHPFEIVEIGGGYQFKTVAYYHPWVRQIFKEKASKRLSIQALECLSIIAYRQPLSKAEIEAIRGVLSDGAMKTLLEKRLITITGRSEKPGRPLLYGTTPEFLKYFGLNKINDLPKIEEFEAMVREKMESMGLDELKNVQNQAAQEASDEATIEVSLPPAADAAPSRAPEPASATEDAGVFEMSVQEAPEQTVPVHLQETRTTGTVMEAETVMQQAIKDEGEPIDVPEEEPVIIVKKKKKVKSVKKVHMVISDEEIPDTAPDRPAPADEAVFEAPVTTMKTEPPAAPVEKSNSPSDDEGAVFEAAVEKEPVQESGGTTEPSPREQPPVEAENEAVFDIGAKESEEPSKKTEAKKQKQETDDDALFEVKL